MLATADVRRSLRGLAALCVLACLLSGCLHRRMMIRSDPPGALVLLEGEEVGYTPVALDFTYYGTREITLIKDGFETKTVMQKVRPPWYQKVPLDLVSDNFIPGHATDRHEFSYQLQASVIVSNQELLERANGLRSEALVTPDY